MKLDFQDEQTAFYTTETSNTFSTTDTKSADTEIVSIVEPIADTHEEPLPKTNPNKKPTFIINSAVKSPLENLYTIELIPTHILDALIADTQREDKFNDDKEEEAMLHMIHSNRTEQLKKYRATSHKRNNNLKRVKTIKKSPYGRVFPESALGSFALCRKDRNSLVKDLYTDIDMKNCHYIIASNIYKSYGIVCCNIDNFIKNRVQMTRSIMDLCSCDKSIAKKLFISLLNNGSFKGFLREYGLNQEIVEPDYIINLHQDCQRIGNYITKEHSKTDLHKKVVAICKRSNLLILLEHSWRPIFKR